VIWNVAIFELLEKLNNKEMKLSGQSRKQRFESLDRPAALSLPLFPYEFAAWRKMTLGLDYHILAEKHYYSVPFQLVGGLVDIRVTTNIVEAFCKGARVASHARSMRSVAALHY
jgi:transposase